MDRIGAIWGFGGRGRLPEAPAQGPPFQAETQGAVHGALEWVKEPPTLASPKSFYSKYLMRSP